MGLDKYQRLHHYLTSPSWEVEQLRALHLKLILEVLKGRTIILIIDETGDKKKRNTTDYVKRQYIGNLGKVENGVVAVTAYSVFCGMTFPLLFEVYKPAFTIDHQENVEVVFTNTGFEFVDCERLNEWVAFAYRLM